MNEYSVGNIIECPFAFTSRQLTLVEFETFMAGGGLPASVGVAQVTVQFDWYRDDGAVTTLTGAQVLNDGVGAYHANITITEPGVFIYRGYSFDGSGNPVAATVNGMFRGRPFR